jgi:hypothetical protein
VGAWARARLARLRGKNAWCPRNHRQRSCSLAVVEVQQSAQPRPAGDPSTIRFPARRVGLFLDQLPTKPLMKAFPMVVGHEFLDDEPQMPLTEKDEVIQALVPDDAFLDTTRSLGSLFTCASKYLGYLGVAVPTIVGQRSGLIVRRTST